MDNWILLKDEKPPFDVFVEVKGSDFMGEYGPLVLARIRRKDPHKPGVIHHNK